MKSERQRCAFKSASINTVDSGSIMTGKCFCKQELDSKCSYPVKAARALENSELRAVARSERHVQLLDTQ